MEMNHLRQAQGMKKEGRELMGDSFSEGDWISPEDLIDDGRESCLPSRALAADEEMIDRLLSVSTLFQSN